MFNIGGGEILVIALIALVVLGPQRLPDAARKAGKMMSDLRQLSSGFQREVQQAFEEHGGAQAVQAASTLKSMTGGPLGPVRTGINAAVAAVSSQATATAPAPAAKATKRTATKKAPAKKAPAKKTSATKASTTRAPAAKKAAPSKTGPAKKASPVRKSPAKVPAKTASRPASKTAKPVPKAARPRSTA